jgi:hypothetical protein
MALADMILKARVNLALVQDPRVGVMDIGVAADNGIVTLTGDVDSETECRDAEQVVLAVDGVTEVHNELTCGVGARADTAEKVRQKFIQRLDEAWEELPDHNALTQADYLRWALWMVYKFRIPDAMRDDGTEAFEGEIVEEAIGLIAGFVGAPRAFVALEMVRQAEAIATSVMGGAPEIENAPLTATPVVDGEREAA